MFSLYQTTPTAGDCTALYDIIFYKEYTVREFVNEVLTRHEYGTIKIKTTYNEKVYSFSYKNNNCESIYDYNGILDLKVKQVTGYGGWGLMDYTIYT